ncbi:hypothetical protein ACVW19_000637 [Streptomyces sp. TE5632]
MKGYVFHGPGTHTFPLERTQDAYEVSGNAVAPGTVRPMRRTVPVTDPGEEAPRPRCTGRSDTPARHVVASGTRARR